MESNSVKEQLEIVIYGAGAIGATICGFLIPHYDQIYLLARGDNAKAMKSRGLILYQKVNNAFQTSHIKL